MRLTLYVITFLCFHYLLQEEELKVLKKELHSLYQLVKSGDFKVNDSTESSSTVSQVELDKVKKENEKLKMRIDILKKVNILLLLLSY